MFPAHDFKEIAGEDLTLGNSYSTVDKEPLVCSLQQQPHEGRKYKLAQSAKTR